MSKLNNYRVVREHYGDKAYATGDTRVAAANEVAHLVPNVLELIGPADAPEAEKPAEHPAAKAEPEPLNKAENAAPANKAASPRKSKRS